MLPENRERWCWGKVHGKTIPKIGGEDWEGPPADGSKIVGWHHKLVGITLSQKKHVTTFSTITLTIGVRLQ